MPYPYTITFNCSVGEKTRNYIIQHHVCEIYSTKRKRSTLINEIILQMSVLYPVLLIITFCIFHYIMGPMAIQCLALAMHEIF